MKTFSLLVSACLLGALAHPTPCRAEALTPAELDRAVAYLEHTRDAIVAATEDLTPEQWAFQPAPDRWSVAQVVEHLAAAEDFLRGMVERDVLAAPARTEPADLAELDAMILKMIPDRTQRFQAPEPLQPTARYGSPEESLEHFRTARGESLALLRGTPDLREHATPSPLGAVLDGYQWLLFIAAHSERHTAQILEVKADPAFPAR